MQIKLTQEEFEEQLLDYLNLVRKKVKLKPIKVVPAYKGKTLEEIAKNMLKETEVLTVSWLSAHSLTVKLKAKKPFKSIDEVNSLIKKYTKRKLKHIGHYLSDVYVYEKSVDISYDLTDEDTYLQMYELLHARLV